MLCCLLQDLGGYVEDSSRVADHAHKFTTNIDRVSPQLYYGVVITEIKVGNISVPLDCTEVSVFYYYYYYTHTHTRTHTHTHTQTDRNLMSSSLKPLMGTFCGESPLK